LQKSTQIKKQQQTLYVEKMVATCSLELVWAQNI
jgi:hypothetical protein